MAPALDPHEDFWRRLALTPRTTEDPAAFVGELAEAAGLPAADRAFLADQGPQRLLVYRKLMRNTLREALRVAIPRTLARLDDRFEEFFVAFCAERGTTSHYLRDVTGEYLDFCEPRWRNDARIPDFLVELGRLEAVQIEIAAAPGRQRLLSDAEAKAQHTAAQATAAQGTAAQGTAAQDTAAQDTAAQHAAPAERASDELELDRGVVFSSATRLLCFEHRVHELPESEDDRSEPLRSTTHLFVYRSAEHEVRYLELSPLASSVIERLLAGATLRVALIGACTDAGVPLDEVTLGGAAQVLAELGARGVLLGPAEASGG